MGCGCAGEAMDRCKVIEVRVQVAMTIEYPYECSGPVEGLLRSCEVETKQADYTDNVVIQVTLPKDREVEFHTELVERTSGRALITEPDRLT